MDRANINDQQSITREYDRTAFAQDAARNARGNAEVLYGVTIFAVAEDGAVAIRRTAQQVAEGDPDGDSIFIAAYRMDEMPAEDAGAYQGSLGPGSAGDADADYERFIQRLIERARNARFKRAIGQGEERLKGFRGG